MNIVQRTNLSGFERTLFSFSAFLFFFFFAL